MVLHGGEARFACLVGQAERRRHLPRIHRTCTDLADLPLTNEIVEGAQGFLHRRVRVESMELVEIDRVDAETAKTRLTGLLNMLTRKAAHVGPLAHRQGDLGRNNAFFEVSHLPKQLSSDFLGGTERIHVRRVEEVDTRFERALEEGTSLVLIEHPRPPFRRSIAHAPETDPRDAHARPTQNRRLHLSSGVALGISVDGSEAFDLAFG